MATWRVVKTVPQKAARKVAYLAVWMAKTMAGRTATKKAVHLAVWMVQNLGEQMVADLVLPTGLTK